MKSALSSRRQHQTAQENTLSAHTSVPRNREISVLAPLIGRSLEQEVGRIRKSTIRSLYRRPKNPPYTIHQFDHHQLMLNKQFQEIFAFNGLLTFDSLMNYSDGEMVKDQLPHRTTTRISLESPSGEVQHFYLKRHTPAPWQEYFKTWSRLRPTFLGACHEWAAILRFHACNINTMTPVAYGKRGRSSLLITESLENYTHLFDWIQSKPAEGELYSAILEMARLTRRMHAAGLHHQDYYLNHLMIPADYDPTQIHLIDLGRARQRYPLTEYWVIKDLAQWNYSARILAPEHRKLFFEFYFGKVSPTLYSRLIGRIQKKTNAISRHSTRHSLG